jgi:hypothetical protein
MREKAIMAYRGWSVAGCSQWSDGSARYTSATLVGGRARAFRGSCRRRADQRHQQGSSPGSAVGCLVAFEAGAGVCTWYGLTVTVVGCSRSCRRIC